MGQAAAAYITTTRDSRIFFFFHYEVYVPRLDLLLVFNFLLFIFLFFKIMTRKKMKKKWNSVSEKWNQKKVQTLQYILKILRIGFNLHQHFEKTKVSMFLPMMSTKLQRFGASQALFPLLIQLNKFTFVKRNLVDKYTPKRNTMYSWGKWRQILFHVHVFFETIHD